MKRICRDYPDSRIRTKQLTPKLGVSCFYAIKRCPPVSLHFQDSQNAKTSSVQQEIRPPPRTVADSMKK